MALVRQFFTGLVRHCYSLLFKWAKINRVENERNKLIICYFFENHVYIKVDKSKLFQTCVRYEGNHKTQNLLDRVAI